MLAHLKPMDGHSEAIIDLAAIRSNVAALHQHAGGAEVMAVVKSDGYGHGLIPTATAALAGGATWLGVGQVGEAVALRDAGIDGADALPARRARRAARRRHRARRRPQRRVTPRLVRQIAAAADAVGRPARLHLKVDTGHEPGRCDDGAVARGARHRAGAEGGRGRCEIIGIWSHLACADMPGHPSVDAQLEAFRAALDRARRAGVRPLVRHLANTPALLTRPDTWFDLVRPGGGVTGLCTCPGGLPTG